MSTKTTAPKIQKKTPAPKRMKRANVKRNADDPFGFDEAKLVAYIKKVQPERIRAEKEDPDI